MPYPPADASLAPLREAAHVTGVSIGTAWRRVTSGVWPGIRAGRGGTWYVPRAWLLSARLVEEQLRQTAARHLLELREQAECDRRRCLQSAPGPHLLIDARDLLVQFERVLSAADADAWQDVRAAVDAIRTRLVVLGETAHCRAIEHALAQAKDTAHADSTTDAPADSRAA